MPVSSIMKEERLIPSNFLPYIVLDPHAPVAFSNLAFSVRKKREVEVVLFSEFLLGRRSIRAYPYHGNIQIGEMLPGIS